MKTSAKLGVIVPTSVLLALPLLISCGGDGVDTAGPLVQPTDKQTLVSDPVDEVVIIIGNLSDITGPSSNAMTVITMALEDIVEYYNENNLISGVEVKVLTYDGQADPSRDVPGYEWLRDNGADVLFTSVPFTATTLEPRINDDEFVLFASSGDIESIDPPGYVFSLGTIPQHEALTLLKWIAENDPDFPEDRPAKIGGAGWIEGYSSSFFAGAEEYAEAHPDQFEWVGGYLTNYTFTWGPEVVALKDCDYVYPGVVLNTFVREYRAAGYTGKFIGTSAQTAFFGLIYSSDLWDEIDGSLFVLPARWWTEEGSMIDLVKQLLHENHPNDVEDLTQQGMGYLAGVTAYQMLGIIGEAVEAVGPGFFDSQALHAAAENFSVSIDGIPRYSFGKDKRWMIDQYAVFEASGDDEDLFRVDPEWIPVVTEP